MAARHVLIVDDEEAFRETLSVLLSMDGFSISEAASGDAAVRLVERGLRPDVVLLDYRMPGLSGGQTLEQLRSRGLLAPAVLLTAASDADELARRHGFDHVLRKPVGPDDLLGFLQQVPAPPAGT